ACRVPLSRRSRAGHEGDVPIAVGERPATLRRRGGGQAPAWGRRLHRRLARLRPQDYPPRPAGPGDPPGPTPPGHHSQRARPKKGGGGKPLVEKLPELVPAFHAALEDHTAGSP